MRLYFRFRRQWPPRLDYRDATVILEAVERPHPTIPMQVWVLQARKIGARTPPCEIFVLALSRQIFDQALGEGFEVESGTPAAKIMARLVEDGCAEEARPPR